MEGGLDWVQGSVLQTKKEKVKITRLHKVLKERKGSEFGDFSIWDPG